MPSPIKRIKSAVSAFMGRDPTPKMQYYGGYSGSSYRTSRRIQNERSIINSVLNKIAVDCSMIDIKHVRLNENGRYEETISDSLNTILTTEANIDQTGRMFISDAVYSMLDEGCIALVATHTDGDPALTDSYEFLDCRVGKIVEWFPWHVRVEVYNDETGRKEQIIVEKRNTPIIENPFYQTMNEPNSTLQRLIRILNQLDRMNEHNSAGKMDLIIQLPYQIKSEAKQIQAERRRRDLEEQLTGSQYGIGYVDGTEKIVQLNRSIENNLWVQYTDLKEDLFSQLGFSKAIFDGTADEKALTIYYNRSIEPIMTYLVEEIERKWISKTARTQRQAIRFFRDPFKIMSAGELAEMSDKLTRNEIMTSNEIRSEIGLAPSKDPKADQLRNSNLNHPDENGQVVEDDVTENVDLSKFKIK